MSNTTYLMYFLAYSYEFRVMGSFKLNSNALLQSIGKMPKWGIFDTYQLLNQHGNPHFLF